MKLNHRDIIEFVVTMILVTTIANAQFVSKPCPAVDTTLEFTDINIKIPKYDKLCTLMLYVNNEYLVPVGRSYDGYEWEVSAGLFAGKLHFDCSGNDCMINLPNLNGANDKYILASFDYILDQKSTVARFLEQATFGATNDMIDNWDYTNFATSFEDWITSQMEEVPLTSHREFYRLRANPRLEQPFYAAQPGPFPCSQHSRWRKFAITVKDRGLSFVINSLSGDNISAPYEVKVNGFVRTILQAVPNFSDGSLLILGHEYTICFNADTFFKESESSPIFLINNLTAECKENIPNPLVQLINDSQADYLINLPAIDSTSAFQDIDNITYNSVWWDSYKADDEFMLIDASSLVDIECNKVQQEIWDNSTMVYPIPPIFGKTTEDGQTVYMLYDPRLVLQENTLENPIPDGGGQVSIDTDGTVFCSNVRRSPFNEDYCKLSINESACSVSVPPTFSINLDAITLQKIFNITNTHGSPRYVYAIDNLPITDEIDEITNSTILSPPCELKTSRWKRQPNMTECTIQGLLVQTDTAEIFTDLLQDSDMATPRLKDVKRSAFQICNSADVDRFYLGYVTSKDINNVDTCWRHVHPQHLNVYDMTNWVNDHPGGAARIQKWNTTGILSFPQSHELIRFQRRILENPDLYPLIGKLEQTTPFVDLPLELQTPALQNALGTVEVKPTKQTGVVICGSPGEVANDPSYGFGFDLDYDDYINLNTSPVRGRNRNTIWGINALSAPDQLRQRVAWALSQILVISPESLKDKRDTEKFLDYYDIFVRHAFGNYRDILKWVSYSPRMGQYLSYIGNKSYQYYVNNGFPISYPDENFAREIMQLFSIGLVKLNRDGTPKLDENGLEIQTYSDTDIISFARAWTGFANAAPRGNVEARSANDPMYIRMEIRDHFPKTDLDGGYIGDGRPLCVDLPPMHHHKKGATYRLLGGRQSPELQNDIGKWENDPEVIRLELNPTSTLYNALCAPEGGNCTYPGRVVLNENLECTASDDVCKVDTIRTVRVQSSPYPIYYEYLRTPCVEQGFFNGGKKVKDWTLADTFEVQNMMCADPRRDIAAETCCKSSWETSTNLSDHGYRNCVYTGERMTYAKAEDRCSNAALEQCDDLRIRIWQAGACAKNQDERTYFSWSTESCEVQVIIRDDGAIAIGHKPEPDYANMTNVPNSVSNETNNFFKASWKANVYPTISDGCAGSCEVLGTNCVCSMTVNEVEAFSTSASVSKELILSSLHIGAFDPSMFDGTDDNYQEVTCGVPGVRFWQRDGLGCSSLETDTIFKVIDGNGVTRFVKNMNSTVTINDGAYSFRNPVHFISLVDTEVRDAHYETDAVLDFYFYNENHPPFLVKQMIQLFGISNPSQRYVKDVVDAYTGTTGSGDYGDLGAMIKAILLDPEARSNNLVADQTHGSLREPVIKVVSAMRALEYYHDSPLGWPFLNGLYEKIGQGPHEAPSVFSFFLPDFLPPGPLGKASLHSPEAQALTADKLTNILEGYYGLVDSGLQPCRKGFAARKPAGTSCRRGNLGVLTYSREDLSTLDDILDDLTLLLTAGRLNYYNSNNRDIIKMAVNATFDFDTNRDDAIRQALDYILTTPEFHSTNLVNKHSGLGKREPLTSSGSVTEEPYKAIIFLLKAGGCDSWNMLVPMENCETNLNGNNLFAEYAEVRDDHAKSKDDLLPLDATSSDQPCYTFGLNNAIPTLRNLYNSDQALFFANTGVLQTLVGRGTWSTTQTPLFSHNSQQEEAMRVDILNEAGTTGVLGRIVDVLKDNGSSSAVTAIDNVCKACYRNPTSNDPITGLSNGSVQLFSNDTVLLDLNERTDLLSGMFAETWASKMHQSVSENEKIFRILNNSTYDVASFGNTGLDQNFARAAQWIKSREERGVRREAIFIEHGGYDLHDTSYDSNLERLLGEVNNALSKFQIEMENADIWENVVVLSVSDFGRTLVNNGNGISRRRGTDHGWGGHYFMTGGSVKGGRILGKYPSELTNNATYNIGQGRGRMIPSTPWESIWNGIAQWMGVPESDLDSVLPNRVNFPKCALFTDKDLFTDGIVNPYTCPVDTPAPSTSFNPSSSPSVEPTMSSSPSNSIDPSTSPSASLRPSSLPSSVPSIQPSVTSAPSVCEDDPDWFYTNSKGEHRYCDFIGRNPDNRCSRISHDGVSAEEACLVACGVCNPPPTTSPSSSVPSIQPSVTSAPSVCEDDPDWFYTNSKGEHRYCDFIGRNPHNRCSRISHDGVSADEACLEACGVCNPPPTTSPSFFPSAAPSDGCQDDPNWLFTNNIGVDWHCEFIAKKLNYRCSRTNDEGVLAKDACLVSCETCSTPSDCEDDPNWYYTNYKGRHRYCSFIAGKHDYYCSQTNDNGILGSDACPVTCGTCPA